MQNVNLLVSFKINEYQKQLISKVLSELCNISYLDEVQDRKNAIGNADIILAWNPKMEFSDDEYPLMKKAKIMQLLSAGADHLTFNLYPETLEIAGNVGAYARPMSEHVMAMTLALAKNLRRGHNKLKEGNFDQFSLNKSIYGTTCAILGFGGIGKATANLMRAFGTKIFAINTSGKTDEEVDFIGKLNDLEYVLKNSDIVVISLPLSKFTRELIGEKELSWMKPDAILVNVARGEIIDEKAFYEFLSTHPNFKAGIDAWWIEPFRHGRFEMNYPFADLPNVLCSPHNSGMVPEAIDIAIEEATENIKRYIQGEKVKGIFNKEEYI